MIRLSANSLSYFGKCHQFYYNAYQRKKILRDWAWPLEFGSAVHNVLGVYDIWRLGKGPKGASATREDAVLAAVERADINSYDWAPWQETTKYNSWNLARIPIWYDAQYGEDNVLKLPTRAPSPSENSLDSNFNLVEDLFEFEYRGVILNGRIDLFCSIFKENLIVDRKSTGGDIDGSFMDNFSPDVQFTFYLWCAEKLWPHMEIGGLLCEAIQLQVGSVSFERFIIRRSKDELLEFEGWLNRQIDERKRLEGKTEYDWAQNFAVCFGCPFRKPCSSSREERKRFWTS